jgi:hypothetical protein
MDTTKELIANLQELGAEEYSYEIKSFKQSIIQLLQEILQLQKEKNLSMKQHKVSILQASNSIVQNAMQSIGVVNAMQSPSLRQSSMFASQTTFPLPDDDFCFKKPKPRIPKKMSHEIFHRKMQEKWGPCNDNTSKQ